MLFQARCLPPSRAALQKHVMRANYQTAVWKAALVACPQLPDPEGHGWKAVNGVLAVDWSDETPAPKSVLEFLACKCHTGCQTRRCHCHKNGLNCTDACSCLQCENITGDDETDDEDEDDEDDDDV